LKVQLPYGSDWWTEEVDLSPEVMVASPPSLPLVENLSQAVRNALASPLGTPPFRQLLSPEDRVAIVVNDITRGTPSRFIVDALAEEMEAAGIRDENVTLVVATGTHRASTGGELGYMLGEHNVRRFRVVNHDCKDRHTLTFVGETKGGLSLWVNGEVAQATVRILTGSVRPHQLAGFSGGRKSIMPGVADQTTITCHHSLPFHPFEPAMGRLEGNQFHEEAVEGAKLLGVTGVVNTVSNSRGQAVGVVAGDLVMAHEAGTKLCARASQLCFPQKADVTLVSPGGYPHDINLHQAQKAIAVAELVTKPNGPIILLAECRDGMGGRFAQWLQQASNPQEVVDQFRIGVEKAGLSKAMAFARAALRHPILVVSKELLEGALADIFLRQAASLNEALRTSLEMSGTGALLAIIPHASDTVPLTEAAHDQP